MEKELKTAIEAAKEAGKKIMEVYECGEYCTIIKPDDSPVTIADSFSEKVILEILSRDFGHYGFITEESFDRIGKNKDDRVWIIDPLDGTKEFIKQNGDFSVNIALVENRRPILGIIYLPCDDVLYYAVKGKGAFFEKDGLKRNIKVSEKKDELTAIRSRSRISVKYTEIFENEKVTRIRKVGSAKKACLIASGLAEIHYSFGYTMEWDTAAMDILVHEAGGVLEELDGKKMIYNREDHLNRNGFYMINNRDNLLI